MKTVLITLLITMTGLCAYAQEPDKNTDTTVFSKQSVKSIAAFQKSAPGKFRASDKVNPFVIHTGKIIRTVRIKTLGFESNVDDTARILKGFGVSAGKLLHRNTSRQVIENNLLFAAGNKINPLLLADNERFLRDQVYIQDAVIVVERVKGTADSVDVLVIVKDVFSLGVGLGVGGTQKFRFELKDENIGGTGSKIGASTLWDNKRNPVFGLGAEFLKRNAGGSFINWNLGFKNYNNAFNSNRNEEHTYYLHVEKPLATQYLRWMGALDIAYNKTSNAYLNDSLYKDTYKYSYYNIDGWFAYNFGAGKLMYSAPKSNVRKFLAFRGFHQHFNDVPDRSLRTYDGTYASTTGLLTSFSFFKQSYYRATYIYGFGRNEDVAVGFNASVIGGYTLSKDTISNNSKSRPYYGLDASFSNYNKKDVFSAYTFRLGGYRYRSSWEDADLLFNVDHFTRLRQLKPNWYQRFFFGGGFAKQFKPVLEQALMLRSQFALPYFEFGYPGADFRATTKAEITFYHTKKYLGFGFAPFIYGDLCLLKPTGQPMKQSDLYSAFGSGFRIRNENLIFGTIEVRGSYFPRILPFMNHLKVKISTNLRFRYNSTFIRRPDFVLPN